jgi:hypothetical protein
VTVGAISAIPGLPALAGALETQGPADAGAADAAGTDVDVTVTSMGLTAGRTDLTAMGTENYLASFPYLGIPHSGFTALTQAG